MTAETPRGRSGDPNDPMLLPHWVRGHTNLFATLVAAVVGGIGLFLIGWLAPVIGPMGAGLFLAALASPLLRWFERRGRSVGLALTLTVGLMVVLGVVLIVLTIVAARSLTEGLAEYSSALHSRFPRGGPTLSAEGIMAALREVLPPEVLADILRTILGIVIQVGQSLVFAIIVAALLLLDSPRLSRMVSGGLGSGNPVFREAPAIAKAAVTYFTVRIRVNAVTAVSMLVLLLLLGVDDAWLWALGTFFLSFVPYLGLILAMIPPAILALAESGPVAAAIVVIGATVLNVVAENILEPTLTGRALSLSTWVVFVMFFFWVWLIGPIGALLSMPITVLIVLVLQHNEPTQWVAALLTREQESSADGATARQRTDRAPS
jgi:predicted PurR-regulated permease PerM